MHVCMHTHTHHTHTHTHTRGLELSIEKVTKQQPELRVSWMKEKGWNYEILAGCEALNIRLGWSLCLTFTQCIFPTNFFHNKKSSEVGSAPWCETLASGIFVPPCYQLCFLFSCWKSFSSKLVQSVWQAPTKQNTTKALCKDSAHLQPIKEA